MKLIITEEEKKRIRSLYNPEKIQEQSFVDQAQEKIQGVVDKSFNMLKNIKIEDITSVLKTIVLFPINSILSALPPVMMGKMIYFIYKNKDNHQQIKNCVTNTNFQFPEACKSNLNDQKCYDQIMENKDNLVNFYSCLKNTIK